MVSASVRRQQVEYVNRRGLSLRNACALLSVARSTLGYQSRVAQRDAGVLPVMRELAGQYPRYGYRRIQVFLGRRGRPRRPSGTARSNVEAPLINMMLIMCITF